MKINNKNIRYNVDAHHHGLFIKEARLRQGYRLIEVADEICDISYLSKIESGMIIPRPEVFAKLAKKLEIHFPTQEQVCLTEIFRKALYQEDLSIIEPYLTLDIFHHYEIQMFHFFHAILKGDLPKALILKKTIDQFHYHFDLKEEQLYMLFSGIYFFKNDEWEAGEECFKKSLDITYLTKEEDPYLCFELAKYYFQIQKTCLGFSYLERATSEFKKIFEKSWVFKCHILWCKESIKNDDIRNIEDRLEELRNIINPNKDDLQWSSFFNILAMICEKKEQNVQAEEYFSRSIEPRAGKIIAEFIIDKIKFHYRRQNNEQMIKLIDSLDLNVLSIRNKLLIEFYYFKAIDETSECFENFLRQDAIPFAMKGLDHESAKLYTKELTSLHRNKLSYKKVADAYYKWEKFCDKLNLIGQI